MITRDITNRIIPDLVTVLNEPSGASLYAVRVGKGAYELTNTLPPASNVSAKTKQKNRARNKAARKARGKK